MNLHIELIRVKIKGINCKLSKIKLEDQTKSSILDLIDEKVESDMKEVLNKMDVLTNVIFGIKNELKTENHSLKNEIKINVLGYSYSHGYYRSDDYVKKAGDINTTVKDRGFIALFLFLIQLQLINFRL